MPDPTPARQILQSARTASLGTLDDDGVPLVTLVTVVATSPTTLVMLLSGLAKHTKNLNQRPTCSLLLVEPGGESGDPMAGARVTVLGTATRIDRAADTGVREAFLEAHPTAAVYADFEDFAFYQLDVREAHLVAGFGRIETIPAIKL